jgi:hypothetical protein
VSHGYRRSSNLQQLAETFGVPVEALFELDRSEER